MTKFENNKFDGRKKLEWDTKNMQVTNFDLANQFIKRKYSSGWNLD